tara:strand:+ start:756 stop:1565 length:810 start_codon:yes stop_codon:yes gene_type:complete
MDLNKFNLKKKNIVITGAAGKLGFQHIEALLDVGANIVATDINLKNFQKFKKNKTKKYKNLEFYKMDVTSEFSINNVLNLLKKKKKKIDVLINNACLNPDYTIDFKKKTDLENFSLDIWNKEISVGLTGAFLCSKLIGSYMKKNKNGGVILNISSDLSVISPDQRLYFRKGVKNFKPITYSVIKTGLIGLTRYLATYWANQKIRCNALSPGGIENKQDKNFKNKIKKLIPMGRMAKPDEYRSVLQFLCSDASNYLNGQNIVMDGGRSIW